MKLTILHSVNLLNDKLSLLAMRISFPLSVIPTPFDHVSEDSFISCMYARDPHCYKADDLF